MTSLENAHVAVRRVASIGTFVAALEMLSQHKRFREDDLLGPHWESFRAKVATRHPRLARALKSKAVPVAAYSLQAGASAATFLFPRNRTVQAVGGAVLASMRGAQRRWSPLGGDGADEMQNVINAVMAATALIDDRGKGSDLAMRALALETTLAYVASGVVKAVSPVWLKGDAFAGVIGTRNYGDQRIYRVVAKHPALSKAVSWATIAVELCFPLVYVLPRPAARLYLAAMAGFHLGIGQFMGLNRFVLAFCATHPAIDYVLEQRATSRRKALP